MKRREFLQWIGAGTLTAVAGSSSMVHAKQQTSHPNIVYILADDLGYGDVSCLNPQGKIPTPHMDSLAKAGMIFTDAHSGSAVCTPTRYGILTGRYAWRSRLKSGVLYGYSQPLIPTKRMTVASVLKKRGYHTACIGKWHLGLDWSLKTGGMATDKKHAWEIDYAKPIQNGPTALGFDYFFGISASLDMPPYVYIENGRCTEIPTVTKAFHRKGPAGKTFEAVDVLPDITKKAVQYIDQQAKEKDKPFFLYFPLNSPHTPIVPTKQFKGKSKLNAYGDFVMQTDWSVGQVLQALERNGLENNTLVIMTSDNGCSPQAKFAELKKQGHNPSYHFRGHKADIYEGGHRIPFIARWPGKINKGSICNDTICLTDLMSTCAVITGTKLPDNAGEDSVNILPDLLGKARQPLREATVHHSINGSFSIRQGKWKLELCPGSGGWSAPRPRSKEAKALPPIQLYDLSQDIAEQKNLQAEHPEVVKALSQLLQNYIAQGRSTPGKPQTNEGKIKITYFKRWKFIAG